MATGELLSARMGQEVCRFFRQWEAQAMITAPEVQSFGAKAIQSVVAPCMPQLVLAEATQLTH